MKFKKVCVLFVCILRKFFQSKVKRINYILLFPNGRYASLQTYRHHKNELIHLLISEIPNELTQSIIDVFHSYDEKYYLV